MYKRGILSNGIQVKSFTFDFYNTLTARQNLPNKYTGLFWHPTKDNVRCQNILPWEPCHKLCSACNKRVGWDFVTLRYKVLGLSCKELLKYPNFCDVMYEWSLSLTLLVALFSFDNKVFQNISVGANIIFNEGFQNEDG
jgi:hypothetical protein